MNFCVNIFSYEKIMCEVSGLRASQGPLFRHPIECNRQTPDFEKPYLHSQCPIFMDLVSNCPEKRDLSNDSKHEVIEAKYSEITFDLDF